MAAVPATPATPATHALFARDAWLPDGWQRNVLLEWDEHGTLSAVTAGHAIPPAGIAQAAGPVLPGMPNLHSHAFQRALAGLTEYRASASDTFWSWRDLMYRHAAQITPEGLSVIARWLYIEMLKAGYTSVCEFHYVHHMADGQPYPQLAALAECVVDAAQASGIGLTLLPVLYQYSGFGRQAPRAEQQRFLNSPERLLRLLDEAGRARPPHGGLRYGVAPHSLRAVSAESLQALLAGLDAHWPGAPVHLHIAEQQAEVEACLATYGARPVQWLLEHFPVDARWCLVHATHLEASEVTALARSGACAGLCPSTEANLGDGVFAALAYLEAGGRFGIGSDSHICVDWRSELRLLEYAQRLVRQQRNVLASSNTPEVAERLYRAALEGGARATGRAVGALAPGLRADWIVLDPDHPGVAERAPRHWLSGIVFGEHGATPVRDVYAGGRKVVDNRQHCDEGQVYAEYRAMLARLPGG
ncbi:formimidoylglutamate deiminase [Paraburkholderia bonniea]|uniref:formimidoylglutamate deiminase n=1 Tax=Paraburkholderia bonniea TaxID=2152891 RepID=UPI002573AB72|nr:formimidoylglutamate deiminase [Paraburkholderia bonniea]WJF91401.1 formimidoylglutamate deiminase [Paraburkholderia bonniea]WJF94718.1 formimidoylglutamate deiminase [Paraburkholderia bonniea]